MNNETTFFDPRPDRGLTPLEVFLSEPSAEQAAAESVARIRQFAAAEKAAREAHASAMQQVTLPSDEDLLRADLLGDMAFEDESGSDAPLAKRADCGEESVAPTHPAAVLAKRRRRYTCEYDAGGGLVRCYANGLDPRASFGGFPREMA